MMLSVVDVLTLFSVYYSTFLFTQKVASQVFAFLLVFLRYIKNSSASAFCKEKKLRFFTFAAFTVFLHPL